MAGAAITNSIQLSSVLSLHRAHVFGDDLCWNIFDVNMVIMGNRSGNVSCNFVKEYEGSPRIVFERARYLREQTWNRRQLGEVQDSKDGSTTECTIGERDAEIVDRYCVVLSREVQKAEGP